MCIYLVSVCALFKCVYLNCRISYYINMVSIQMPTHSYDFNGRLECVRILERYISIKELCPL